VILDDAMRLVDRREVRKVWKFGRFHGGWITAICALQKYAVADSIVRISHHHHIVFDPLIVVVFLLIFFFASLRLGQKCWDFTMRGFGCLVAGEMIMIRQFVSLPITVFDQ
jgi:hypothetical protein